jgi:tetratricopeptide (TPR) repeat protein
MELNMAKGFIFLLLFLLAGCSAGLQMQGRKLVDQGRYDEAVDVFYEEIKANPSSAAAWRELGVAFYEKGNLIKAEDALTQANSIQPDVRTNLYLGLIYEKREQYDAAVSAYKICLNLKPRGKAKTLIETRLNHLTSEMIRRQALQALNNESEINADTIPENSIAVVDFDDSQLPEDLAPISKGLAEFTAIDLSKVSSLHVVDRLKIDLILDELKLSASPYADPSYAPRLGRLVGGRRLVTGALLGEAGGQIRLQGAIMDAVDSSLETTEAVQGDLHKFFQIQKDFVFKIIGDLGITLTSGERDAIKEVPTESLLAFMAYCRGLGYQHSGMPDAAAAEFKRAMNDDPAFGEARAKYQQAELTKEMTAKGTEYMKSFEAAVATETGREMIEQGLDIAQETILINAGFIDFQSLYDMFSNSPLVPPRITNADLVPSIVIIRGNPDAD